MASSSSRVHPTHPQSAGGAVVCQGSSDQSDGASRSTEESTRMDEAYARALAERDDEDFARSLENAHFQESDAEHARRLRDQMIAEALQRQEEHRLVEANEIERVAAMRACVGSVRHGATMEHPLREPRPSRTRRTDKSHVGCALQ